MPNHLHGIIELSNSNIETHPLEINDLGTSHGMSLQNDTTLEHLNTREFGKPIPGSISVIINQYKSSVKRWCNKNNFRNFQWQSRLFDHIIRSEDDYTRISNYIINNPTKWKDDKFYQQ